MHFIRVLAGGGAGATVWQATLWRISGSTPDKVKLELWHPKEGDQGTQVATARFLTDYEHQDPKKEIVWQDKWPGARLNRTHLGDELYFKGHTLAALGNLTHYLEDFFPTAELLRIQAKPAKRVLSLKHLPPGGLVLAPEAVGVKAMPRQDLEAGYQTFGEVRAAHASRALSSLHGLPQVCEIPPVIEIKMPGFQIAETALINIARVCHPFECHCKQQAGMPGDKGGFWEGLGEVTVKSFPGWD